MFNDPCPAFTHKATNVSVCMWAHKKSDHPQRESLKGLAWLFTQLFAEALVFEGGSAIENYTNETKIILGHFSWVYTFRRNEIWLPHPK